MTEAYNMDSMELMKRYPDNYFQLAVVDPPYGEGKSVRSDSSGGTWKRTDGSRFGGRFDRYNPTAKKVRGGAQKYHAPEQAEDGRQSTLKKLWLGTTRQAKNTSMSCFAFLNNRSYGVEITLDFHRPDAS